MKDKTLLRNVLFGGCGFLLIHHYHEHSDLEGFDRIFQIEDIQSHEAWILAFFTSAIVLTIF